MPTRTLFFFRLGLFASLLGIGLVAYLFGIAQSGPSWEVPAAVITKLRIIPFISLGLALLAGGLFMLRGGCFKAIEPGPRIGYLGAMFVSLSGTVLVWVLEPEQWPGRYPALSIITQYLAIPIWAACAVIFWRLGRQKNTGNCSG